MLTTPLTVLSRTRSRHRAFKLVAAASVCNFLEMYDFMVFGYYAPWIARAFFPFTNVFFSLMLALVTFGAGFLMRPVGAVVLGAYIDNRGRRAGMLLTSVLMLLGTLTVACVPGYATLGLLSPLLVLAGRLVQGLAAGAIVGGVSVYLSEVATPGHRGFYVSWQSASQQVAVVMASLIGILVNLMLPAPAVDQWGWRIPFYLGGLLIPVFFVMQRVLIESPEFARRATVHRPTLRETLRGLAINARVIGLATVLVILTTVSFYLITAFTPTYGTTVLHLSLRQSLTVTLCIGTSNFVLLPLMGALSDRIGRLPLLRYSSVAALLTGYPALLLMVGAPSFAHLLAVELFFSVIYAGYSGAMIVFLTEIMPIEVRVTGFSLAYSLAVGIFGGFTPAICTWLIHVSGNKAAPGIWLAGAALIALLATFQFTK